MPLRVEMPKVAIPPVREPYSPTRISDFCGPLRPQDSVAATIAARKAARTMRVLIISTSSVSRMLKDGVFFRTGRRKVKMLSVNGLSDRILILENY